MNTAKENKNIKNRVISQNESIRLWVAAGGRCEYPGCNEYLLQDSLTTKSQNFGEMAHNVGKKKTKESPRGINTLSLIDRSKAQNHLLLCSKHHKLIDSKEFLDFYTIEELRKYKEDHEARIKYLTSLSDSRKSIVLRMMNKIHQDCVLISNEEIVDALWKCANRYPEYLLNTHNNLEINLSDLPDIRDTAYWKTAITKIDQIFEQQIFPQIGKLINHLSIFAIAPIPLLIYLGAKLGDKIRMDIYQKQFNAEEDWVWCKGGRIARFHFNKIKGNGSNSKIAIILSISGKVAIDSLPKDVKDNFIIYEFYPKNISPNRDIIQNKESLVSFKKVYQQMLREIEATHGILKELILFPAVPISISIFCGRGLLKALSPKVLIYDLINKKFQKAITLNLTKLKL